MLIVYSVYNVYIILLRVIVIAVNHLRGQNDLLQYID